MWDKPQLLMWLANLLYALAALLFMYALLFVLINLPVFPVRQIQVSGDLHHITREQVQYIVRHELKGTFFTLNLDRTRKAFEKLPWARNVSIRRRWPDRLEIALEEHSALARWGSSALVNTYGELFDAASNDNLPVLDGPMGTSAEVSKGYLEIRDMLAPIERRPMSVTLSARRAWSVKLDDGTLVEVGRENVKARLSKFVAAYPRTLAVLNRNIEYVDLRYPNGFAVRMPDFKPGPARKPGAPVRPKPAAGQRKAA
ncbi:cell division protein FtsQ/DivIB [Chitinivorax sp. B]|uniref:cell division protein FtsQ/DivIB n=1 Tax=Chitinivorax sp. B TaxID=2502235 RepID=UPI0010F95DA2|nr:cell division protein FtsQ/DivIB [Chitinivorax sp. B]